MAGKRTVAAKLRSALGRADRPARKSSNSACRPTYYVNPHCAATCRRVRSGPSPVTSMTLTGSPAPVRSASLVERRGFELPVLFGLRMFGEGA